jgi:hypothetical protein
MNITVTGTSSNQPHIRLFSITSIRPDIRQAKSVILLDTAHQKRPDYPAAEKK